MTWTARRFLMQSHLLYAWACLLLSLGQFCWALSKGTAYAASWCTNQSLSQVNHSAAYLDRYAQERGWPRENIRKEHDTHGHYL